MGSGLILLVIVAAWLAVLVPMALRSHDADTSLSSVDRFSDAMRVLSRRDAAARARAREVAGPARLGTVGTDPDLDDDLHDDLDDGFGDPYGSVEPGPVARLWERAQPVAGAVRDRLRAGTPAARRRRLLAGLVLLSVGTLVAGVVGPAVLLVVHGVVDVVLVLVVLQLRRLALRRAAQAGRAGAARSGRTRSGAGRSGAGGAQLPATPLVLSSVRVTRADVPAGGATVDEPQPDLELQPDLGFSPEPEGDTDREGAAPVTPAAVAADADHDALRADEAERPGQPAVAAQHVEDPVPAASPGLGAPWQPVPVPVPTYVTAPVAPPRAYRTADLSRPGERAEPAASEHLLGTVDEGLPPDEVVERRRAVNEW